MRKLGFVVAAVAVGAAVAGAVIAKRSGGGGDIEQWVERMPENAPPRWVFRNVTAIRENTERILQILESDKASDS